MQITQIHVFPVDEDKLKAYVSVILDNCFVVSDIKVIQGADGLFISMPSKRRKNGTYRDVAHPLNQETRRWFEEAIIGEYRQVVGGAKAGDGDPLTAEGSSFLAEPRQVHEDSSGREVGSGFE